MDWPPRTTNAWVVLVGKRRLANARFLSEFRRFDLFDAELWERYRAYPWTSPRGEVQVLAEAVPIDFGSLLLVLLIAALGLAVLIVVAVFGFVLAPRAGRGSRRALGWWIAIVALEAVACLGSFVELLNGHFGGVFIAPAIVAAQVTIFVRARRARAESV